MTILSLLLDGLIILLLAAAIGFALFLNARLTRLRDFSGELEKAVLGLDGSIAKAESGLAAIQRAAEGVGQELDRRVEPARALAGELGFIAERAEQAAERLERAIAQSRTAIAGEEARDLDEARRFAQALRPLNGDDQIGRRPAAAAANDEAPRSRGAALVRALRGMR